MTKRGTNASLHVAVLCPLVLLLAVVVPARLASSQHGSGVRVEQHRAPELQPLSAVEAHDAVAAVMRQERRAAASLSAGKRVETILVERYQDEDKGAPARGRRAHVVLYNYDTNETISAVVSLGAAVRVDALSVAADQPPAPGPAEVERATQMALVHPTVRARLQAAGMAGREHELLITHLLVRGAKPGDPCATRRCIALFFNTRDAVLPIEPIVDLTSGHVIEIH